MTEHIQNITKAELTPAAREEFENLTTQYHKKLATHGVKTIKQFIKTNPTTDEMKHVLALLKRIQKITKNKTIDDEEYNYQKEKLEEKTGMIIDNFHEGRARARKDLELFFIDPNGNIIAGPFLNCSHFQEGAAAVQPNGEFYYYIDRNGDKLFEILKLTRLDGAIDHVQPRITGACPFSQGKALVAEEDQDGHVEEFYINKQGEIIEFVE